MHAYRRSGLARSTLITLGYAPRAGLSKAGTSDTRFWRMSTESEFLD